MSKIFPSHRRVSKLQQTRLNSQVKTCSSLEYTATQATPAEVMCFLAHCPATRDSCHSSNMQNLLLLQSPLPGMLLPRDLCGSLPVSDQVPLRQRTPSHSVTLHDLTLLLFSLTAFGISKHDLIYLLLYLFTAQLLH